MSNFMDASLTRAEMKRIGGGAWTRSCVCGNGKSWTGSGETCSDFTFFDNYYCGGGSSTCSGPGNTGTACG